MGQTVKDPNKRFTGHFQKGKFAIGLALRKYGIKSFDFTIIDHAISQEELDSKEIYWITETNCISPNGYNLQSGGGGRGIPSEETRKKMSISQKGKSLGKVRSEKFKLGVSIFHSGKFVSLETKAKQSAASTGEKNAFFNKHLSDETREKMRISAIKRVSREKIEGYKKLTSRERRYARKEREKEEAHG